mmetsp:Transcript_9438/g.10347  ORF Transcript_9438/g.10347 Transcript_9438/m.10347 type:complete len:1257 (-) Transcript_9438:119-3889(-)
MRSSDWIKKVMSSAERGTSINYNRLGNSSDGSRSDSPAQSNHDQGEETLRTFYFGESTPEQQRCNSVTTDDNLIEKQNVKEGEEEAEEPEGSKFRSNSIRTAKYTKWTFVPKNLWEQFQRVANVYFLFNAVLQTIPEISFSNGAPTMMLPLSFILIVTALKDLSEDRKRQRSDAEENNKSISIFEPTTQVFETRMWKEVRVGDIVKVKGDHYFPADLILLSTSNPDGKCYIETKSLDGESNLKVKSSKLETRNMEISSKLSFRVDCEPPNENLYKFSGVLTCQDETKISVDVDQFLLRGSSLRATSSILGVVVYTGHETKIMKNSTRSRLKRSKVERLMNRQLIIVCILQVLIAIVWSVMLTVWFEENEATTDVYLDWANHDSSTLPVIGRFFVGLGIWFLLLTNLIPISLMVTLEMVKYCQAYFIVWDEAMVVNQLPRASVRKFTNESDPIEGASVQNSTILEELGQVQHVFSDKTGTLTQNVMEFRKMTVGKKSYGTMFHDAIEEATSKGIKNVNFFDPKFWNDLEDLHNPNRQLLIEAILLLSLCHTVLVDSSEAPRDLHKDASYDKLTEDSKWDSTKDHFSQLNSGIKYNASSPDELALVNAARHFGCEFVGRDEEDNIQINFFGETRVYQLINILEFTSDRKRMSVVVRTPEGEYKLLCKGADSVIRPLLTPCDYEEFTYGELRHFAVDGLRTLVLAGKVLEERSYMTWSVRFCEASSMIQGRQEAVERLCAELETNLQLIGSTGIEDKLQDRVPETLLNLKLASIKIWVLTGDKIETAINIASSCNLIDPGVETLVIDTTSADEFERTINGYLCRVGPLEQEDDNGPNRNFAVVVSGTALGVSLNDPDRYDLSDKLLELTNRCDVVIACRVSPKQKADVVHLVKDNVPNVTTLAIGDGANDVSMITAADVGVGIRGLEGQQASRAADFVIDQFSFLQRLLFVHGREAYRRNSTLILYNFFKNVILMIPLLMFGLVSGFSGQICFSPYLSALYNMTDTGLPPIWYAVFDREMDLDELHHMPHFYIAGVKSRRFTVLLFWLTFLYGMIVGGVLGLYGGITFINTGMEQTGDMNDLWGAGSVIFLMIIVAANVNLAMLAKSISGPFLSTLIGSVVVYVLTALFCSQFRFFEVYGAFPRTFLNPLTYVAVCFTILFQVAADTVVTRLFEIHEDRVGTKERVLSRAISKGLEDRSKSEPLIRSGFAFTQDNKRVERLLTVNSRSSSRIGSFIDPSPNFSFQPEFREVTTTTTDTL